MTPCPSPFTPTDGNDRKAFATATYPWVRRLAATVPLSATDGSTTKYSMPSRDPGSTAVLIPLHRSPSANTTWFIRLSLALISGRGSPTNVPSGRGPSFWSWATGVTYGSTVRSMLLSLRFGSSVPKLLVWINAQVVIWSKGPGATAHAWLARQSNPDMKYSVPFLLVS